MVGVCVAGHSSAESLFSFFPYVGSRDRTQVSRFVGKVLYLLSYLISPSTLLLCNARGGTQSLTHAR